MKMTMHIDEGLLDRVIKLYGCSSKTEAVNHALSEMERRHRLRGYATSGLGLSADELREGVAADYDVITARGGKGATTRGRRCSG